MRCAAVGAETCSQCLVKERNTLLDQRAPLNFAKELAREHHPQIRSREAVVARASTSSSTISTTAEDDFETWPSQWRRCGAFLTLHRTSGLYASMNVLAASASETPPGAIC